MEEVIKVAIADDHKIFRNGLITSLAPYSSEIKIIYDCGGGRALLEKLAGAAVDVVLVDMKMPDMDGREVCKEVKKKHPDVHVIGLSVYEHQAYITGMFDSGASGYLLKDVDPGEIVTAIKTVCKEGLYYKDEMPLHMVKRLMAMNHPSVYYIPQNDPDIKTHEIELLKLIAEQKNTSEIAEQMNLSVKTIEKYRMSLMERTGARNMAGLVTYAIKKGYVVV